MGDFEKHIGLAREKLKATANAFNNKQYTVVGDLATKVVEQLVEADASIKNEHFGTHKERHDYSSKNFPSGINTAMRNIWFAYGDLGYDGVNGKRAKKVVRNLAIIVKFFEEKLGVKIE